MLDEPDLYAVFTDVSVSDPLRMPSILVPPPSELIKRITL